MAVDNVGMDVPVKFGDSRSNGFRDIQGADFVLNERTGQRLSQYCKMPLKIIHMSRWCNDVGATWAQFRGQVSKCQIICTIGNVVLRSSTAKSKTPALGVGSLRSYTGHLNQHFQNCQTFSNRVSHYQEIASENDSKWQIYAICIRPEVADDVKIRWKCKDYLSVATQVHGGKF